MRADRIEPCNLPYQSDRSLHTTTTTTTGTTNSSDQSKTVGQLRNPDLLLSPFFNDSYVVDLDDQNDSSSCSASSVCDNAFEHGEFGSGCATRQSQPNDGDQQSVVGGSQEVETTVEVRHWPHRAFGKVRRMVKRLFTVHHKKESTSVQQIQVVEQTTQLTEHNQSSMEEVGLPPTQHANPEPKLEQAFCSLIQQSIEKKVTTTKDQSSTNSSIFIQSFGQEKIRPSPNRGALDAIFTARPSTLPIQRLLPSQTVLNPARITLVLDLDETLSHSILETNFHGPYDYSFRTVWYWEEVLVKVKFRPHLEQFLKFTARNFEVVVFSASLPQFANPVLDKIDPEGKIFSHRLFRDSCTLWNGWFVKDLASLNRVPSKTVIVDNSPFSYLWNPNNAIPIKSWYQDPEDDELIRVMQHLQQLVDKSI